MDEFIHSYCDNCNWPYAPCGYFGPDEPPDAHTLPKCPVCMEHETDPCPQCGAA